MEQSLDRISDDVLKTADPVSVSVPSTNLEDFLNEPVHAFPKDDLARLRDELFMALFGFANLLIASLILSLDYFSPLDAAAATPPAVRFAAIFFSVLTFPIAFFATRSVLESALADLKKREVSLNVLQSAAILIGALSLLAAILFKQPPVETLTFDRLFLTLIFIFALANYVQGVIFTLLKTKAGFMLSRFVPRVKRFAAPPGEESNPLDNRPYRETELRDVEVGDILAVEEGEYFAFDGTLINGRAQVIENTFSASGEPRFLQPGDRVWAGSYLVSGKGAYRVSAVGEDSSIHDFEEALNGKYLQGSAEKIRRYNVKQTIWNILWLSVALGAGTFWIARYQSFEAAASVTMSLLLAGLITKFIQLEFLSPLILDRAAFSLGIVSSRRSLSNCWQKIEKFVIDCALTDLDPVLKVVKIELIDKRIAEDSLPSVLFSLAGRGYSPEALALSRFITDRGFSLDLHACENFSEYPGSGFFGKVSGFEFSLGNEDFLLERGVLVQPGEVRESAEEGRTFWYLALEREVIAYVEFAAEIDEGISEDITILRHMNIRPVIASMDDSKAVDLAAQRLGFELVDINAGLSSDIYSRKLESFKPHALFISPSHDFPEKLKQSAELTLEMFNRLRHDFQQADILLFKHDWRTVLSTAILPERFHRAGRINYYIAVSLTVLLFGLAAMNLISPPVVVLAVACASCAMLLNLLRF